VTPDAKCRRCGADIRWGITEANGRSMPADPKPDPMGIMWVVEWRERVPVFAVASNDRPVPDNEPFRYTSHFATCSGQKGNR
jgi:hypothetical protein